MAADYAESLRAAVWSSQEAPFAAQVTYYTLVPIPGSMTQPQPLPQDQALMPVTGHAQSSWQQQMPPAPTYPPHLDPPARQLATVPSSVSPQPRSIPHGGSDRAAVSVAPIDSANPKTTKTPGQSAVSHNASDQRRRDRIKASEEELKRLVPAAGRQRRRKDQLREVYTELRSLVQGNEAVQQALNQRREQKERE
ncbi:hypothetical protein Tdes44962_MAKER01742 [Teratosphaeria destructans]|uniref:BHLH domain-containing protein n=1 Tax=Teratosphaeria destructans TaxID=418781 RepID=A0A9W7W5D0_9PEZI|nr:hypothetical protein Tdes44962_MAKER01742 [Teratosphaeria destructans]